MRNLRKTSRRNPLLIVLVVLAAAGVILIASAYGSTINLQYLNQLNSCGIYPQATLAPGIATAITNSSLALISQSDVGAAAGPPFVNGLPTSHFDNGSIELSLYHGTSSGHEVVAVVATNIGSDSANVTSLLVFGMIKTTGFEYATVFQGRVIDTVPGNIIESECHAPAPASSSGFILSPGQSITGMMSGSWIMGNSRITGFQPALIFYPLGNSTFHYTVSPDLVWVS